MSMHRSDKAGSRMQEIRRQQESELKKYADILRWVTEPCDDEEKLISFGRSVQNKSAKYNLEKYTDESNVSVPSILPGTEFSFISDRTAKERWIRAAVRMSAPAAEHSSVGMSDRNIGYVRKQYTYASLYPASNYYRNLLAQETACCELYASAAMHILDVLFVSGKRDEADRILYDFFCTHRELRVTRFAERLKQHIGRDCTHSLNSIAAVTLLLLLSNYLRSGGSVESFFDGLDSDAAFIRSLARSTFIIPDGAEEHAYGTKARELYRCLTDENRYAGSSSDIVRDMQTCLQKLYRLMGEKAVAESLNEFSHAVDVCSDNRAITAYAVRRKFRRIQRNLDWAIKAFNSDVSSLLNTGSFGDGIHVDYAEAISQPQELLSVYRDVFLCTGLLNEAEDPTRFLEVPGKKYRRILVDPFRASLGFVLHQELNSDCVWNIDITLRALYQTVAELPMSFIHTEIADIPYDALNLPYNMMIQGMKLQKHCLELYAFDRTPDSFRRDANQMQEVFLNGLGMIPPRIHYTMNENLRMDENPFKQMCFDIFSLMSKQHECLMDTIDLTEPSETAQEAQEEDGSAVDRTSVEEATAVLRAKVERQAQLIESLRAEKKKLEAAQNELENRNRTVSEELEETKAVLMQVRDADEHEHDTDSINFPYRLKHRTVLYGGHATFLAPLRKLLPDLVIDEPKNKQNVSLIRNADVVWIQNNALCHAAFYDVTQTAKLNGKKFLYCPYASAEKCAREIVRYDMNPDNA